MGRPGFWDDPDQAKKVVGELKSAKGDVDTFTAIERRVNDANELFRMALEEGESATQDEIARELPKLEDDLGRLELHSFMSGPEDHLGAVVSIHPGAGGTESQDWAEMLFRMYTRWA
jgi:peptide chain release factor 2